MITELILNATLLTTLAVLYSFISRGNEANVVRRQVLSGLLFGGITIIGMNVPLTITNGIFYDGRSVVLSLAGLFGGVFPGTIAMLIAASYRAIHGGGGAWVGIATIVCSAGIGILFRYFQNNKPESIKIATIYLMGFITHLVVLAWQFLLPAKLAFEIINQIWLPVLLIFPLATMLMGLIFRNEKRRVIAEQEFEENEIRYQTTLLSIGDGVITTNRKGLITFINPMATQLTGWSQEEAMGKPVDEVLRLFSEETKKEIPCPVKKILQTGQVLGLTNHTLLLHKNGTEIPISDSGAPIKDASGEIKGVVLIFKDQTKEHALKNKLIESEHLFHTITHKSPVGIFRTTANGSTTYVNPQWCAISGLSHEEALGFGWLKAVHPDDRANVASGWQKATSGQQQFTTEYRFQKPDGKVSWVLGAAVPELSPEGQVRGYIGTIIDMTKRKLAEDELLRSHDNFRRTIDDFPLGMRILSDTGETLYVNKAFLAIYEYKNEEEFRQTSISSRYTKESLIEHAARKRLRKKGITPENEYEIEILSKEGEIKHLTVTRKLIFWDGHLQNLVIYQDISELKEQLRRQQLFRRAIDESPVTIIVTDSDGKIMYANPKFTEVSGYQFSEVVGKKPSALKSGEHPNEYYQKLWETILNGEDWKGEFLNRRKNGELFWENALISSITDEKGKITHFIGVKEDITEKKKIISDLQAAKEKAEESDRLKSAFLANMSHEIRTPLNAIVGFSNLLVGNDNLTRDEKEEFASILNQSTENLLQVINDILDISKIETGQLKISPEFFDCCPVIHDLLRITQQQLDKSNKTAIKLVLRCDDQPVLVYADKIRFTQIFSNLLSNAVKFTIKGEISFGVSQISETHVRFFVSDTGIGISPDKQENIFERFRQEDDSSTRAYGGAGLGLAISKKLAEQMGGTITLNSILGEGSTFEFSIPRN